MQLYNRAAMTTATTGTGTLTLGTEISDAYLTFAEAGVGDGDTVTYLLREGNDFELGRGVYTASGTTLTRATVIKSKIGGTAGTAKMNLTGNATVRITAAARDVTVIDTTAAALAAAANAINTNALPGDQVRDEDGRRYDRTAGGDWHPIDAGAGTFDDITPA